MISSFGVVLDACALVPVSLCDVLLSAADHRFYRPHWTTRILDEMERTVARLIEERGQTHDHARAASARHRAHMVDAYADAEIAGFESLIPAMVNDEKDRHVLAAAVRANAEVIVTSNVRDFPPNALEPLGIVARTPDDFLKDLLAFDKTLMLNVIRSISNAKSRPPMTALEILQRIGKNAPDFASAALLLIEDEGFEET